MDKKIEFLIDIIMINIISIFKKRFSNDVFHRWFAVFFNIGGW